jgi:hypothetical protein
MTLCYFVWIQHVSDVLETARASFEGIVLKLQPDSSW